MREVEARIAVVLLAAGGSTRLGRPKQLLPYNGSTLLRHAVETALAAKLGPVVLVLGAQAEACREAVAGLPVAIVVNAQWDAGMGGSIAAGVAALTRDPGQTPDAAILMLCDQPGVTPEHLNRLAAAFRAGDAPIVASAYGGSAGVPALFSRRLFPDLMALNPAQGAKALIARHGERVARVDFPEGALDIDTPADYERLRQHREPA
ncbi:MAG TPA: nucleotidyltransferase family protein [Capsulimonadaceae bacterium]|nr:nucleotidyltransferase family protein [Capsulimonadaceae bacterium]